MKMISDSYGDLETCQSRIPTLLSTTKLSPVDGLDGHLFNVYLKVPLTKYLKQLRIPLQQLLSSKGQNHVSLKKRDSMRVANTFSIIQSAKDNILEYRLIGIVRSVARAINKKRDNWVVGLYTLSRLTRTECACVNGTLLVVLKQLCSVLEERVSNYQILRHASEALECNTELRELSDIRLYGHQKDLFAHVQREKQGALIYYAAPTGTGKTVSPIGLLCGHKVIFVCAVRHIGLALAKRAISVGKGVAFAFGCEKLEDVRLHYGAATEFTTNLRTGGIQNVNNLRGEKVELMISDLKSFKIAMEYQLIHSTREENIVYWDEPTISLDKEDHDCHQLISSFWETNSIPTVVLSSATLPSDDVLDPVSRSFLETYPNGRIHSVRNHECARSIPIVTRSGHVVLPHTIAPDRVRLREVVERLQSNPTLLRYIDVQAVADYLLEMQVDLPCEPLELSAEFVKLKYIEVLANLDDYKPSPQIRRYNSTSLITSSDAHTLTDGPTIFMTRETEKIVLFCLQRARAGAEVLSALEKDIRYNETVTKKHNVLSQRLADMIAKDTQAGNLKKLCDDNRTDEEVRIVRSKLTALSNSYRQLQLPPVYLPNSPEHIQKWRSVPPLGRPPFCGSVSGKDIARIINAQNVQVNHKLLLMMGIGVFAGNNSSEYTLLVEQFATEKKLYLLITSPDYIYGTNYQFCHGYLGKDLTGLSNDMIIQAMGRVGRSDAQGMYTFRFRDDDAITHLLFNSELSLESQNLVRLLSKTV